MFILTVREQKLKLFFSLLGSALIIVSVVFLFPIQQNNYTYPDGVLPAIKNLSPSNFKNIKTNHDRIRFLKQFGWQVESDPKEIREIIIPNRFDVVYEKYNLLQQAEGLNLEKYRGKAVKRYTYFVSNYDYDGTVYANLIIYRDQVIGGDICSAKKDGFVHGFTRQNDFLT